MRKNKKNILIVLIPITIIIICFNYYLFLKTKVINQDGNNNNPQEKFFSAEVFVENPTINHVRSKPPDEILDQKENKEKVKLIVFDKNYEIGIKEGDSVFEAMKNLQKNEGNNFSFNYKEYPSLGIFINQMNNIKDGNGKYWIYSINDKEASVGVSKYVLKEGDIIKWELK